MLDSLPDLVERRSHPQRFRWGACFLLHSVAAAMWWLFLPGGFSAAHPRFWMNAVFPLVMLAVAIAGLVWTVRTKGRRLELVVLALSVFWTSVLVCGALIFPSSAPKVLVPTTPLAAVGWFLVYRLLRERPAPLAGAMLICIPAILIGVFVPLSQRSPDADTHPLDVPVPDLSSDDLAGDMSAIEVQEGYGKTSAVKIRDGLGIEASDARIDIEAGDYAAHIWPLLTFQSRSADRCWTVFARRRDRVGPHLRLITGTRTKDGCRLMYRSDYEPVVHLSSPTEGITEIESYARLPQPVYSHLNSFFRAQLTGASQPLISFSPCPDQRIKIVSFDYPIGRPARLAYIGTDNVFHVVEATSGEKGPFHELASGRLADGEPLALTFYDGDRPLFRITLADWARQTSRSLSPTAGWGLPVNSIEFNRYGRECIIYVTLAGTSVGRGWDSVGHKEGTYRNRIRVERLDLQR